MPIALLLALLTATPVAHDPLEPLPLDALLGAAPAAPPPALQGIRLQREPRFWFSAGLATQSLEMNAPVFDEPEEDDLIGGDVGYYSWRGELGVGIEAGLWTSSWDARLDSLSTTTDSIDVYRWMVGLRFGDRGTSERFLPFLRVGYAFREDDGDILADDGSGWYGGAGLDWYLVGGLAISPQVLYLDTESFEAEEFLGTVQLTLQL